MDSILFSLFKLSDYSLLVPTKAHIILRYIFIIIMMMIIIFSFMQGIYTYIHRDKLCPQAIQCCSYSVVTIHGAYIVSFSVESIVLLHQYFPKFVCAVPNMAVVCSSFTSCFPGMLLTYFLNDYEIVPVAPIITGITFVFTFHMRCISIVRSLYFRILSAFLFNHISVS